MAIQAVPGHPAVQRRGARVRELSELASELKVLRSQGQRIVHCHGVFDLLHIGHLRYLQQARELGDVLVVTLTPDRHVNKGPHRPAFSEELRAEMLAALDCVDFVAINAWPTAVEALELLRPHIYAKGAEYRDKRTPEIEAEEAVLDAIGAEMAYLEDLTSSSSRLINRHMSPFPEETVDYLQGLVKSYSADEILSWLDRAQGLRVLVVGETIVDEYHYCQTLGRSSKAPIVAMQELSAERFIGGTAAIANHLAEFCREVGLLTLVGGADDSEAWVSRQLRPNVTPVFVRKSGAPTIVKVRYRESYFAQPMFEVYHYDDRPLEAPDDLILCGRLDALAPSYDLVLVADYGHTMMTPAAIDLVCDKSRYLALNTQANAGNLGFHTVSKYPRADYVCFAEQELRLECRARNGDVHPMLEQVAGRLAADRVTVTRGRVGSLTWSPELGFDEAPSLATEVVDRVGAGDAYLSISSLCAVQEAPLAVQSFLGNVAGAEAVATVGNRDTLQRLGLCRHVESLLK